MVDREMNAYELADAMEEFYGDPDGLPYLIGESAAMLRQFGLAESIIKQQQLEIEALKKEKDEFKIECDRLYRIIELNGAVE
jgi:hypothetical protein